jgi:iron(III) transport system permease protein
LSDLLHATATSFGLGFGAAVLTTIMALPIAILVARYRGPLSTTLERSTYLASSLPGITIALALITVSVRAVRPLYQTTPVLLLAYAILFLPLAVAATRAVLAQASPAVDEMARALGCGPWSTFRRVTLPVIAPGLGTGAALVFLFTITELPATLLLAPIGTQTLATEVWAHTSGLSYGAAAPYAALMISLAALPTYVLTRKLSVLAGNVTS